MKDKNYLVVGASSGIGAALVAQLLAQGAQVWGLSRRGLAVAEGLHAIEMDVRGDCAGLEAALPARLDGLIYCVGSINLKPFNRLQIADFQLDYELNVLGAVKVLQAALKSLKAAQGASVVLFSSVAAQVGFGFHASIGSAKAAVEGLTKALAAEWAAAKIRVNAIAPSLTDTPLAAQLLATAEKREASGRRHPLARVGEASEMAQSAMYLLSDASGWMTGQILHLDGGMSALRT